MWGTGLGASSDALDVIDPDPVSNWRSVFQQWDIDGEKIKRWETRQTLRRRWGNKSADKIFASAVEAEDKFSKKQGLVESTHTAEQKMDIGTTPSEH
ncbi:unnamed protein product [Clonostachys chloroleuca]|uniref:Uncharacterized protein n=1 Tax=Clonostachys chloroleuca TaxID=1926264 RepID=A0AA35PX50_9HYPO|nr:unnamed protein product [Clonostachys chloroleuca]